MARKLPPFDYSQIAPTGKAERDAAIKREWEEQDRRTREQRESQDKPAVGRPGEYSDDKIKAIAKRILNEQGKQTANVLAGKVAWTCENEPRYKNLSCPKDRKLRMLCGEALEELGMKPPRPPKRRR